MAKKTVLIVSLVSLIISVLYSTLQLAEGIKIGLGVVAFISWMAVCFTVFSDAKERGRKHSAWGGLCFLIGWIGGLIYFFTIKK